MRRHQILTVDICASDRSPAGWKKNNNWPKKWGGYGRPGRCGSIALGVYVHVQSYLPFPLTQRVQSAGSTLPRKNSSPWLSHQYQRQLLYRLTLYRPDHVILNRQLTFWHAILCCVNDIMLLTKIEIERQKYLINRFAGLSIPVGIVGGLNRER